MVEEERRPVLGAAGEQAVRAGDQPTGDGPVSAATGYAAAAAVYWRAGWRGVLPVPAGRKAPPPAGWTGADAPDPDADQVRRWCACSPGANLALRLPPGVIGLDVDAYKGEGAGSWQRLLAECGPLPGTWTSTARGAGPSGQRFFRVPVGVAWSERRAGAGVDLIHQQHRYAVVWPSTHPGGGRYRWYTPQGRPAGRVPAADELPWLPPVWGRRLSASAAGPGSGAVGTHGVVRRVGYAGAALAGAVGELAALRPGQRRNDALNRKSFALGGLVGAGRLDLAEVRAALYRAAVACGHVDKHGQRQTLATIDSGLRAGMARPRKETS